MCRPWRVLLKGPDPVGRTVKPKALLTAKVVKNRTKAVPMTGMPRRLESGGIEETAYLLHNVHWALERARLIL